MHFLALLKGGATPKFAAEAFLACLFERSEEKSDLCFETAAEFVMDCFLAINIKVTITAGNVQNELKDFQWPVEALRIYVFIYNKTNFTPFEHFLYQICYITKIVQQEWIKNRSEILTENYMEDFLTPLELLMQLIAVWVGAYKDILNNENHDFFTKHLEEPIARINFQLLRGVRYLRMFFRTELPLLDNICDSLLRTAHLGIMYRESHHEVLNGLLIMFTEEFHIFYDFSPSSINFFYKTLTLKCPKTTYQLVYKSFIELLQLHGINYDDLNIENANTSAHQRSLAIANFMVETRMLNIYYHHLVKENNRAVLLTVIDFLYTLQSKLASLDCFSEVFIEAILSLVLSNDKALGNNAAKLYIIMIQRRTNTETTLRHIIGFYFAKMSTTELLSRYVQRLWKYFQPIRDINYYTEALLQMSIETNYFCLMTSHFAVTIFSLLLKIYGLNEISVLNFLRNLFDVIKEQKCYFTQVTLLGIFDDIHGVLTEYEETDLHELILSVEDHAQLQFDNLENMEYPLLKKWFLLWEFFASKREDFQKINESASTLVEKYNSFMDNTRNFFQTLSESALRKYRCILQRICLVTQSNFLFFDNQSVILSDIQKGLMGINPESHGIFYEYASQMNVLIDVYALEIYTISLIKIHETMNLSTDGSDYQWTESRVQELESHLRSWIQNPDLLITQPVIRIKTLIICFFELHLVFGLNSNNRIINLQLETYEILIRVMTHVIFKTEYTFKDFSDYDEKMQMHPQRVLCFQKLMITRFENFHKCSGVQIDSHYLWHFCFYFGLPEADLLQNEMKNFMKTLAIYCFPIFQRMVPIIIFKLYSHQTALGPRKILNAIKAHKSLLDGLETNDRAMLNVSIVLSVIERIDDSLRPNTIDQRRDRLAPLKHLHKFIENVDLRNAGGSLITQIVNNAKNLRRNLLSTGELRTVDEFLDRFHVETNQ